MSDNETHEETAPPSNDPVVSGEEGNEEEVRFVCPNPRGNSSSAKAVG